MPICLLRTPKVSGVFVFRFSFCLGTYEVDRCSFSAFARAHEIVYMAQVLLTVVHVIICLESVYQIFRIVAREAE